MSQRLLLLLPLLLAGCLGTEHGRPEGRGSRNVKTHGRSDAAEPHVWQQVYLGEPPRPTLVGYVKTDDQGVESGTHWLFDIDLHLVGRVTPRGDTYRIHLGGEEESVGHYQLHHAVLRVFGREKETLVTFTRMPAPRDPKMVPPPQGAEMAASPEDS